MARFYLLAHELPHLSGTFIGNAPGNDRRSSGWKFVKDADVEVAVQGERQGAWNWRGRHD